MPTIVELQQQRGQHVQQMRTLSDKADGESRSLTPEEAQEWDRLDAEQERIGGEITSMRSADQRRSRLAALEADAQRTTGSGARPTPAASATPETRIASPLATSFYRSAFDQYLRGELGAPEVVAECRSNLSAEFRADTLQAGLFIKAGGLIAPQQVLDGLIKDVDNFTFMLQLSRVERLTMAESLGVATLDTDVEDADWTAELKTGNQTDLAIGKRELRPHPLAKRVKISNTLLRRTAGGAEALVNGRLGYKFGVTFEKGGMTGDGVRKPLGIFTASNDGIPTTRDVSTGNTATEVRPDAFIETKHTLKQPYWAGATWVTHRDTLKQVRKQKTGDGQYLWQPGLSLDLPDRILEIPYRLSEYAPNTYTTGQYVAVLGNFKVGYLIVIAMDLSIQVVDQLYAETNQTGFIGRMEADGAPVLAEAFVRMKLA